MPMPVSSMAIITQPPTCAPAHGDPPAVRGELHRIGQEIERDLLERAAVGASVRSRRDLGDDA